jgi:hypothetical protein
VISTAQGGYAGATERARHALTERERALWPATIETADPAVAKLRETVAV